jgi:hypothetical protein
MALTNSDGSRHGLRGPTPRCALERCESLLELPLDSITAKELKKASNYRELARWPGVSGLKPETSASYQAVAERVAKRRGIARVHLDVYWWGGARGAV